jgi:hypothetical protein
LNLSGISKITTSVLPELPVDNKRRRKCIHAGSLAASMLQTLLSALRQFRLTIIGAFENSRISIARQANTGQLSEVSTAGMPS